MEEQEHYSLDEPLDFSEIEGLKPIEPQRVSFEIIKAEAGMSKKGFPKVDMRLKVLAPVDIEDRVIFDSLSFAPKALPFTKEKMIVLGLGDFKGTPNEIAEQVLGLEAVASVGIDMNEKNVDPQTKEPYPPRNVVKKYFPVGTALTAANRAAELD